MCQAVQLMQQALSYQALQQPNQPLKLLPPNPPPAPAPSPSANRPKPKKDSYQSVSNFSLSLLPAFKRCWTNTKLSLKGLQAKPSPLLQPRSTLRNKSMAWITMSSMKLMEKPFWLRSVYLWRTRLKRVRLSLWFRVIRWSWRGIKWRWERFWCWDR